MKFAKIHEKKINNCLKNSFNFQRKNNIQKESIAENKVPKPAAIGNEGLIVWPTRKRFSGRFLGDEGGGDANLRAATGYLMAIFGEMKNEWINFERIFHFGISCVVVVVGFSQKKTIRKNRKILGPI